jgi:hypothetical protein
VTNQDGPTTLLSYKEYDPGTKLHAPDKPESENDRFMFENKVSEKTLITCFLSSEIFSIGNATIIM